MHGHRQRYAQYTGQRPRVDGLELDVGAVLGELFFPLRELRLRATQLCFRLSMPLGYSFDCHLCATQLGLRLSVPLGHFQVLAFCLTLLPNSYQVFYLRFANRRRRLLERSLLLLCASWRISRLGQLTARRRLFDREGWRT